MKRLVVIAEGGTEKRFVDDMLRPYFQSLNLFNEVKCFEIKQSGGGISKYSHVKDNIIRVLYEHDVIVTTMIDYYRLPTNFPGTDESRDMQDHFERVRLLERAMKEDLEQTKKCQFNNFVPNIQLHEFETLIFSSINGFEVIPWLNSKSRETILNIIKQYPNPEEIDDAPETAPSIRLKKVIPGYSKVVYGNNILKVTGMEIILEKCPHFRNWIETLISLLKVE